MKKVLAVLIVSLFFTSLAFAETPTNKAIGYDAMVGAASVRIITSSGIGIQGLLGLNFNSPKQDGTQADMDLYIGGNVLKCLYENSKANLNAFAGIGIDMNGTTIDGGDSVTDFGIKVGLEPEIFLLDNLSVSTMFGLQILINGDQRGGDGKAISDTGSTVFGTYGNGVSIVNGLSFNWYF